MSYIINQEAVEEARAIMKDKFPMMIEYFLEDAAMYINSIDEGLVENDAEKIKSPAHTIKSSANQLGASKLSEIAKEIEHLSKDMIDNGGDDFEPMKKLCDDLKAAFAEVEPEFKKLMG